MYGINKCVCFPCRSLVKALLQAQKGVTLSGSMAYLSQVCDDKCSVTSQVTVDALLKSYEWRARR